MPSAGRRVANVPSSPPPAYVFDDARVPRVSGPGRARAAPTRDGVAFIDFCADPPSFLVSSDFVEGYRTEEPLGVCHWFEGGGND